MKPALIIIGLCLALLAGSAHVGYGQSGSIVSAAKQQSPVTEPDRAKTAAPVLKKTKTGKLPRWHRLIPGMFR